MKATIKWVIAVIILYVPLYFLVTTTHLPPPDKPVHQPDDQIDLTRAALVIAKEVFPDINIDSYIHRIDLMVHEIKLLMLRCGGDVNDPEYRIRCINTYLFRTSKISYDHADFFGRTPSNCFLNGIMDTGKGACFTMPLLYLCLAQRLDFPIYGVNVPQHFILRYDDGNYRSNIEVTGQGGMTPDEGYIEDFKILTAELTAGVFMKNLSNN
ncbi:MAG: hypothetical protein HY762_05835 [Planctomycetes bacterium]|nr:hypothetical protein [Planctomycetota bacterium]